VKKVKDKDEFQNVGVAPSRACVILSTESSGADGKEKP
jgi:hypothetical protein